MANGDMLEDMEFESRLTELGDDQPALIKFVAREQYSVSKILISHEKRITKVEKANKKVFGIVGIVSAGFATVVIAIIDYFVRRT